MNGLLSFLRKRDYSPFVVYRLAVVLAIVILITVGVRGSTF